MKNILVPTDFSACAQNAARAAIMLAAQAKADIHFLHIMPGTGEEVHVPRVSKIPIHNSQEEHANNELNLLVASASQGGLKAFPMLVFDKGNERIENYVKRLNIDLIIMGSHGATGIRELIIGSNTQRVVRDSSVPVLVIKRTISVQLKIKSIVFASTFKEDVSKAFEFVVNLAQLFKSSVDILFINFIDKMTDEESIEDIVQNLTKRYPNVSFTSSTAEANDKEWGIHQFIEMVNADMVALTTYDKTGFLGRRSVAEDMVNHEEIPVLVIGNVN